MTAGWRRRPEVQVTQVRTEATLQRAKQLCSLASVQNPSFFGNTGRFEIPITYRLEAASSALLLQLAALLPLLLLGLGIRRRAELPRADVERLVAFARWWTRPVRLGALAAVALLGFCYGGLTSTYADTSHVAGSESVPYNACTDGGPIKEYDVHAINVDITLNRYFDHAPGFMYALAANIPAIRAFESALTTTRAALAAANDVNFQVAGCLRPGRPEDLQPDHRGHHHHLQRPAAHAGVAGTTRRRLLPERRPDHQHPHADGRPGEQGAVLAGQPHQPAQPAVRVQRRRAARGSAAFLWRRHRARLRLDGGFGSDADL